MFSLLLGEQSALQWKAFRRHTHISPFRAAAAAALCSHCEPLLLHRFSALLIFNSCKSSSAEGMKGGGVISILTAAISLQQLRRPWLLPHWRGLCRGKVEKEGWDFNWAAFPLRLLWDDTAPSQALSPFPPICRKQHVI